MLTVKRNNNVAPKEVPTMKELDFEHRVYLLAIADGNVGNRDFHVSCET